MKNEINQFENIADELANNGFAVCDDFISKKHTDDLLGIMNDEEMKFKKAGIGTQDNFQLNTSIRGDYIKWIQYKNAAPATKEYLSKILQLMDYINKTCFLGLKDFESHYTRYPAGTFYKRHIDQLKFNDHRRLTFILYLNKSWIQGDGGELRIYQKNNTFTNIEPVGGRFVCFRSELLEHEVLECKKDRLSITGWMLNELESLKFLK